VIIVLIIYRTGVLNIDFFRYFVMPNVLRPYHMSTFIRH